MVSDLNQGNPSKKFLMDPASGQGWICISFFIRCATVCNAGGRHGKYVLLGYLNPRYGGVMDAIPPTVGDGKSH